MTFNGQEMEHRWGEGGVGNNGAGNIEQGYRIGEKGRGRNVWKNN